MEGVARYAQGVEVDGVHYQQVGRLNLLKKSPNPISKECYQNMLINVVVKKI